MTLREWVVRRARPTPGAYLSALLVGVMVTATVITVLQRSPSDPVPLAAVTTLVTLIVALLLWLRDPLSPVRSGVLPWFLIALVGVWLYQVVQNLLRDESLRYSSLVLPAAILLIALRTPVGKPAHDAVAVFAWAVVGASAVTLVLEAAGLLPGNADGAGVGASAVELTEYFLPLSDLLNIDGRWAGPFGHPNFAGPMGAYVLIVGLTRRGVTRIVFIVSGTVILLLTGSRSALIAALVGVALLAVVRWSARPSDRTGRLRLTLALAIAIGVSAAVISRNPHLTGRATLWPQVVDLWSTDLWAGVGNAGFSQAIAEQRLPDWAIHAHNVFLDAGTRTGLLGLALCLVAVGLALVLALSAARRGAGLGLALVGLVLSVSMTDAFLLWRYLTGGMVVLVLAALVSAPSPSDPPRQPPQPSRAQGSDPVPDPGPSAAAD